MKEILLVRFGISVEWSGGAKVLGKLSLPRRPTNLDNSRVKACCVCSRCGWGLFGHFFLSSTIYLFSPSLGDGLIDKILSQRAVKTKTTNQSAFLFVPVNIRYRIPDISVRSISMKAVLLQYFCRPGNIASTVFLAFLTERFKPHVRLA